MRESGLRPPPHHTVLLHGALRGARRRPARRCGEATTPGRVGRQGKRRAGRRGRALAIKEDWADRTACDTRPLGQVVAVVAEQPGAFRIGWPTDAKAATEHTHEHTVQQRHACEKNRRNAHERHAEIVPAPFRCAGGAQYQQGSASVGKRARACTTTRKKSHRAREACCSRIMHGGAISAAVGAADEAQVVLIDVDVSTWPINSWVLGCRGPKAHRRPIARLELEGFLKLGSHLCTLLLFVGGILRFLSQALVLSCLKLGLFSHTQTLETMNEPCIGDKCTQGGVASSVACRGAASPHA